MLPDRVRMSCAAVAERATHVHIDDDRLDALAATLRGEGIPATLQDAQFTPFGDVDADLAFSLVMNAVNFGSGWFPVVRKRPGMSGAVTMGRNLRDHWVAHGAWSPGALLDLSFEDVCEVFRQDPGGEAGELMRLFTDALHDLGRFVVDGYDGRYDAVVEAAERSAARMAEALTAMPFYRDTANHDGAEVAFYKRAQLTPAALANTLGDHPLGRFDDLDALTIFADNLVPHVLRVEGVLVYDPELATRVDRGDLLASGSREEVEIRAAGVDACERLASRLGVRASTLDFVLWNHGQEPRYKAIPRHRTRCVFY